MKDLRYVALALVGLFPALLVGCGSDSATDIGKAAEKAKASRVIEIRQLDTHRFDPANVQVKAGETVTLHITNTGSQIHEFFLGVKKDQDARDTEMKGMGSNPMKMPNTVNDVTVDPGGSGDITWTFAKKGTVDFGCHEPGHYADGMKGTITVA